MEVRVASIDEEQYTAAEANEEFEASTARATARPDERPEGGSSSDNGSSSSSKSNGSGRDAGSSEGPFRLDSGQLAKLNGLAPHEVYTSGIVSSAQAGRSGAHNIAPAARKRPAGVRLPLC